MSNSTYEELFEAPATAEPGYPVDTLRLMLMSQFSGAALLKHPDAVICNALWVVQGKVELLMKMVKQGFETEGTA